MKIKSCFNLRISRVSSFSCSSLVDQNCPWAELRLTHGLNWAWSTFFCFFGGLDWVGKLISRDYRAITSNVHTCYYNYYTTAIKHATCKLQVKICKKTYHTAIKLATTLQDLQSFCRLIWIFVCLHRNIQMSNLLQPFTDAYTEYVTFVDNLC